MKFLETYKNYATILKNTKINMFLYNTFSKKKEKFKSLKKGRVSLYTCGPTVYDYDHLGHAWNYTMSDILRRALEYNKYKVKHQLNITDVGHLENDLDNGEDKMEKSALKNKKSVWQIAKYFTKIYFTNRKKLNLLEPHIISHATDHISEMIDLIKKILKKGKAYQTNNGVYFSVEKFPTYGLLSGNTLEKLKAGARIEINSQKKHPADFALWKLTPKNTKRQMEWNSPWGKGFPGWHIECSAMIMKHLGTQIDIHTGGEDNIFPHHECEIAQTETITNKKFVQFWFHARFLTINGEKMSKSLNNFYTLSDIEKKGFSPLSLRYLFLTSHYRSKLNFTWESLQASQIALDNLYQKIRELKSKIEKDRIGNNEQLQKLIKQIKNHEYKNKFLDFISDDLNTPKALALIWKLIKDESISEQIKYVLLLDFDQVLGLNLSKVKSIVIPQKIKKIIEQREKLRQLQEWQKADELRNKITELGYLIDDTSQGTIIKKYKI